MTHEPDPTGETKDSPRVLDLRLRLDAIQAQINQIRSEMEALPLSPALTDWTTHASRNTTSVNTTQGVPPHAPFEEAWGLDHFTSKDTEPAAALTPPF